MNFKKTNKIFKVVLSVGDESGIGPEIILKALYSSQIPKNIDFILVGSKKNLHNTYRHLRSLGLKNLANPKNLKLFMNFLNANKTLKVVLSVGDESGIGPEIILKALCSTDVPKNIDFIVVLSLIHI